MPISLRSCFAPLVALAACALAAPASALTPDPLPNVFGYDPITLVAARERFADKDSALKPAFDKLFRDADKALSLRAASVMDKKKVANSGDKHDYFSLGPYWWPDPTKPDGLPYIRRDGEVNPESKADNDALKFPQICNSVELLGLAYYFTGKEVYAEKAAQLTRVWFLDEATRMNPNLTYAQGIPGRTPTRGTGILEARHLAALTDGLALISTSPAWSTAQQNAMRAWLETYYKWLVTSKNGRDEAAAPNNHGSWYAVQAAHLELALGKKDAARKRIEKELTARVASQILADGRQPHELERTNSLGYTLFNLEALFSLAQLGERAGYEQAWTHTTKDGRSLRAALAYVAPYVDLQKKWPKEDIKAGNRDRIAPLLRAYLARQNDAQLFEFYQAALTSETQSERWTLLLPPVKK